MKDLVPNSYELCTEYPFFVGLFLRLYFSPESHSLFLNSFTSIITLTEMLRKRGRHSPVQVLGGFCPSIAG